MGTVLRERRLLRAFSDGSNLSGGFGHAKRRRVALEGGDYVAVGVECEGDLAVAEGFHDRPRVAILAHLGSAIGISEACSA